MDLRERARVPGLPHQVGSRRRLLADGSGELTRALGLELDGTSFGMGTRSQRYAMIVDDGTVTKLAVEDPGQFEVSNAESILEAL